VSQKTPGKVRCLCGKMRTYRELQNVAAGSDIFRDETGVPETAEAEREKMGTSQNSEDDCQAERTETREWLWWLPP